MKSKEALENLKKDLEILDILKRHLCKGGYETDDGEVFEIICLIGLDTQFYISEEFKKVKEWMEDDIH